MALRTQSNRMTTMVRVVWKIAALHFILAVIAEAQQISDVRLSSSISSRSGIVEVYAGATSGWRALCHTPTWGFNDAQVVCRQLGYPGANRAFGVEEPNQGEPQPMTYHNQQFTCSGNEPDLNTCGKVAISANDLESCSPAWATCYDDHYLGCYGDEVYDRVLTAQTYPMTVEMSSEICIDYCLGLGHPYAGVEYSSECYCGHAADNYARLGSFPDNQCTYPCAGYTNESCGGPSRVAVYRTVILTTLPPTTEAATTLMTTIPPSTTAESVTSPAGNLNPSEPTVTPIFTSTIAPSATSVGQAINSTMTLMPLGGQLLSPPIIMGLAVGGGIIFVLLTLMLLVVFTLHRRRHRKKASFVDGQRMTTVSAKVEQVMDTTYLDPMNSMSDSAVYSGFSAASESDFDSTFGIGEPSAYLGLSFRDMERRQEDEYTSLHSELRQEGSFAMAHSTLTTPQPVYGDGSEIAARLGSREALEIPNAQSSRGQGLYDKPDSGTKSAIYASGGDISPYECGFGYPEGEYSPVHQATYCEVGEAIKWRQEDERCRAAGNNQSYQGHVGGISREYASVVPQDDRGCNGSADTTSKVKSANYQNPDKLASGEYAVVSEDVTRKRVSQLSRGAALRKQVMSRTLPVGMRSGPVPHYSSKESQNGGYDSVYFDGGNTSSSLPGFASSQRNHSSSPHADIYPDYATIHDDHENDTTREDDSFESDISELPEDHSYSYTDHKKLLVGRRKKSNVEDIAITSDAISNPSYVNLNASDRPAKRSPKLSVSSIVSQMSPRIKSRKYSVLDEEHTPSEVTKSTTEDGIRERTPSSTISRDSCMSEVEYAVVDKGMKSRDSETMSPQNVPDVDDDEDYDILQHTSTDITL